MNMLLVKANVQLTNRLSGVNVGRTLSGEIYLKSCPICSLSNCSNPLSEIETPTCQPRHRSAGIPACQPRHRSAGIPACQPRHRSAGIPACQPQTEVSLMGDSSNTENPCVHT